MKSKYINSTTGRMPAIAAPTPRPMIALSEIGVSRTRSPKRSCKPRVRPNTLPPAATSMPATNTRSSVSSSTSSAARIGVHRAEHRSIGGRRRRFRPFGTGPDDEIGQRRDRGRSQRPRRVDGIVELARNHDFQVFDRVVGNARGPELLRADDQRVARFPLLHLLGRSVTLRIAFVVTVPAVGRGLDDDRPAPGAHRIDHRRRIAVAVATTSFPSTAT